MSLISTAKLIHFTSQLSLGAILASSKSSLKKVGKILLLSFFGKHIIGNSARNEMKKTSKNNITSGCCSEVFAICPSQNLG